MKPSPLNFIRPLLFSHFVSSNLHVFVRSIVAFLPSQSDSQIHINLNISHAGSPLTQSTTHNVPLKQNDKSNDMPKKFLESTKHLVKKNSWHANFHYTWHVILFDDAKLIIFFNKKKQNSFNV